MTATLLTAILNLAVSPSLSPVAGDVYGIETFVCTRATADDDFVAGVTGYARYRVRGDGQSDEFVGLDATLALGRDNRRISLAPTIGGASYSAQDDVLGNIVLEIGDEISDARMFTSYLTTGASSTQRVPLTCQSYF